MKFTDPDITEFKLGGTWKGWFAFVFFVLSICVGFILNLIRLVEINLTQYWWLLSLFLMLIGLTMVSYGMWYYLELITFRLRIASDRLVYRTLTYHREILFTEVRGYRIIFPTVGDDDSVLRRRKSIVIIPTAESGKSNIEINHYITDYGKLLSWISVNFTLMKPDDQK